MAFNKSHLFDPADQVTSAMAQLISHPARVDILRYLAQNGPTSVEKLADRYPLSKSTVSQHLEYLRKADLVQYRESYPHTIYSIDLQTYTEHYSKLMEYCLCLEQAINLLTHPTLEPQ
jgi:ArsR family transcriptional regulator